MQHINQNIGLVHFVVKKQCRKQCKVSYDDLIQEGTFGLIEAQKRYNPEKGAFSTYAVFWIRKYVNMAITKQSNTIRVPCHKFYEIDHYYTNLEEDTMQDRFYTMHSVHNGLLTDEIEALLNTLTAFEKQLMYLRYGFLTGQLMTFEQIGGLYNVSRETIRVRHKTALNKLRKSCVHNEFSIERICSERVIDTNIMQ